METLHPNWDRKRALVQGVPCNDIQIEKEEHIVVTIAKNADSGKEGEKCNGAIDLNDLQNLKLLY